MFKLSASSLLSLASELGQKWTNLLMQFGFRRRPAEQTTTLSLTHSPPEEADSGAAPIEYWVSLPPYTDIPVSPELAEPVTTMLSAYLLGTFRVMLNDVPIRWPKGRDQAVFKYLLTHHERPIPREVLMEAFWPEAEPQAARNRLNVALHHLRQALRTTLEQPVIVYDAGAYGFHPDLCLWLDVEEFERRVACGKRFQAAEALNAAVVEYEAALNLYQGDFLVEDPYDGWPVVTRERLRADFLETLDQLSRVYFSREQYAACVALCQRILAQDNCSEEAHRRLMRCYSRQGQHPMALRQYKACVEALQT